jgi:hypothetical protein
VKAAAELKALMQGVKSLPPGPLRKQGEEKIAALSALIRSMPK